MPDATSLVACLFASKDQRLLAGRRLLVAFVFVLAGQQHLGQPSAGAAEALPARPEPAAAAAPETRLAVVDTLAAALADPDRQVRLEAARALERIGPGCTEAVVRCLQHADPSVRVGAIIVLARFGADAKQAVPALTECLVDPVVEVRFVATKALRTMGREAQTAAPALSRLLADPDRIVRMNSADALEAIGAAAVPPVAEMLVSAPDAAARMAAADVLRRIGAEAGAAVPALAGAMKDPAAEVRNAAAQALRAIDRASLPAAAALGAALNDPDRTVRLSAAGALERLGTAGLPHVTAQLSSDDWQTRVLALRVIEVYGPEAQSAAPVLSARLLDSEPAVREAAARSLRAVLGKDASP